MTAAIITLTVSLILLFVFRVTTDALGDTDDAMRLVLVRDLLSGTGWYDQWVGRLQPPVGGYMHWSRLLDGALASLMAGFRLVMSPTTAELTVRTIWPLLWIFPAVASALVIARRLAGPAAVFVCGLMLATNLQIYVQFHPGRVDHHNVQVAMAVAAAAFAMMSESSGLAALAAGVSSALGLAIGVEALLFQAVVGVYFGLRAAIEPSFAPATRNYALALALATLTFFSVQTPPWRWSLSFCDAMGVNLVAAIVVAGAGLVFLYSARHFSASVRLGLLAGLGLAAGGAYLALDPQCIHGPLAAVDPRVRPFWFDQISELRTWPEMLRLNPTAGVPVVAAGVVTLVAASIIFIRSVQRLTPETCLGCFLAVLAVAASASAFRMQDYLCWFGLPVVAAAVSIVTTRFARGLLLPTIVISIVLSPIAASLAAEQAFGFARHVPEIASNSSQAIGECGKGSGFDRLAALAPGVVLADTDLGSYVLAYTRSSVLAAPYHRMTWGILAAHGALGAPPTQAAAKVRGLHVTYVVICKAEAMRVGPESLGVNLERGRPPAWLEPLSTSGEMLQVYRVIGGAERH